MPYAEVNGQRLYYEDSGGSGLPLVLAHGLLMDCEMFAPQVAALRGRHRVVTWDERGHGRTETTHEDFSYWDSAEDLAGLLDCMGIDRAVVGGMSQGGFVSLRFALRYPARVLGLVLIDTQAGLERPDADSRYGAMVDIWSSQGPTDVMLDLVAAAIIGPDWPDTPAWAAKWRVRPSISQIFRTLTTRDDITHRLEEIHAPALVIHGEEDVAIDLPRAEAVAAGLPNARPLVRIPGAGHAANLTHPEPVNAEISKFLEQL